MKSPIIRKTAEEVHDNIGENYALKRVPEMPILN